MIQLSYLSSLYFMYIFNEVLCMSSIHFRLPGSQYGGLDLEGLYTARLLDHMLNKQNFSRKIYPIKKYSHAHVKNKSFLI